jgi:uncharacterized protein YwgA
LIRIITSKKGSLLDFIKNMICYLIGRLTLDMVVYSVSVDRPDWALIIIGCTDFIEGATRIQKYGFLGFKMIKGLTNKGFYNDWIASKYGPFSPSLANDIDSLVSNGLIQKKPVKNEYNYLVDRFILTSSGEIKFRNLIQQEGKVINELKTKIIDKYNTKTLMDILHDVYYQFPEYAMKSRIKPNVGRKIYESDSYLSIERDEPDQE